MADTIAGRRTDSGFRVGPADVSFIAVVGEDNQPVIRIKTEKHFIDVRVTKTGQMRVYLNGLQCAATKGKRNG